MRAIESFRNKFLVNDYQGTPIAVLTAIDGATEKDLDYFTKTQVPNGIVLVNLADYLEKSLARKCRPEATNDEKLRIITAIVDEHRYVIRYQVKPRQAKSKPSPGERAKALYAESEQRRQTAEEAVDPKLRKLLAKKRDIEEQIAARIEELHLERSRRDAKADSMRGEAKPETDKTLADRFRELMRRQDAENPRRAEAIRMGLLKERKA